MNNPGPTKLRAHSLRAYVFSLMLHVAVAGCAVLLMVARKSPVAGEKETIFTIESGADEAGLAVAEESGLPESGPESGPQDVLPAGAPVQAAQVAETPDKAPGKIASEPQRYLPLLSELPRLEISPDGDADDHAAQKPFESKNWLEEASAKAPITMVSNRAAPAAAVDPMDAYFAVFIQSIRDAYRQPGELEQQRPLTVRVQYEVAADGTIGTVDVVRSSGSAAYDQSVLKAFRSIASIGPRPDSRSSINVADFCLAD